VSDGPGAPLALTLRGSTGLALAAEIREPPAPTAPTVLLMHGGGQNRHAWSRTAGVLCEAGHVVVAYDARGHGDSDWDPTGRYDMEDFAHDLLAVRRQVAGDDPVIAVGASMGGMAILNAHRLAGPHGWLGVVLVDVTPRIELEGVRRIVGFMTAHPEGLPTLDDAAGVIAAYNPHRPRPDRLDGLLKVLRQTPGGRWVWRWDPAFMGSRSEQVMGDASGEARMAHMAELLFEGARAITGPTLLVRGGMSDLVSEENVREFLRAVPHARYVDVAGTGHMVAGDDNDAFTGAVLSFLGAAAGGHRPNT
jgi:pimeloyl-ACP methyl ester carboxylesterase